MGLFKKGGIFGKIVKGIANVALKATATMANMIIPGSGAVIQGIGNGIINGSGDHVATDGTVTPAAKVAQLAAAGAVSHPETGERMVHPTEDNAHPDVAQPAAGSNSKVIMNTDGSLAVIANDSPLAKQPNEDMKTYAKRMWTDHKMIVIPAVIIILGVVFWKKVKKILKIR